MVQNSTSVTAGPFGNLYKLLQLLGPGVLMATAAVGGSHLVASTQAGAQFGWQLALLILAVNLFKYPFFRASVSYTFSTRQSLQQGYAQMGKGYLLTSFVLNMVAAVVNSAALLMFAASLLSYFLPVALPIASLAAIVLLVVLFIVIAGHFNAMNQASKVIMAVLIIATLLALAMAWQKGAVAPAEFVSPSPWTLATIGFLVITMGWMPAPIEVSCITSLWLKQQCQERPVTASSALFDFNLGYFTTMLLALVFLALGALVLHGNGEPLATGGIGFSAQLINLYALTIGEWSRYLVALIAFLCIFGSTLTVYDGYSRALAEGMVLLKGSSEVPNTVFVSWLLAVSVISFIIVLFFKSALIPMLSFAMTLAFTTTPMFAWLNYKLVKQAELDQAFQGGRTLSLLTYAGLIYLFGFLLVFVAWKWFF